MADQPVPAAESVCRFCGQPIEWWHPESHVIGYWRHVESDIRCDLWATPIDGPGPISEEGRTDG